MARKVAEVFPVDLVNSVNPARIEGQKTASFEVVDALGDAPDIHCLPVGNAGNITAYWRGYREYGAGAAETMLGTLLKARAVPREDLVLVTKAGIRQEGDRRIVDVSRRGLLRELDGSLARLGCGLGSSLMVPWRNWPRHGRSSPSRSKSRENRGWSWVVSVGPPPMFPPTSWRWRVGGAHGRCASRSWCGEGRPGPG